jgi:hypothetical protein
MVSDCNSCLSSTCPYFDAQEIGPDTIFPKIGECPRKAACDEHQKQFIKRDAHFKNVDMVNYFVKKGLKDKLPDGMFEIYGGLSNDR